jgi:hypothetical protein
MGQGGPRLAAIFPTPVILDELEDAEDLNRELEKAILARRETDTTSRAGPAKRARACSSTPRLLPPLIR